MLHRIALLCLSLLLMASGTASAVQSGCPAAKASQMSHAMAGDCHMDMGGVDMGKVAPAGPEAPDMPMDETACCCPAIVAALPPAPVPADGTDAYPPLFDMPLDADPVSVAFVPEPPPPRA